MHLLTIEQELCGDFPSHIEVDAFRGTNPECFIKIQETTERYNAHATLVLTPAQARELGDALIIWAGRTDV